MDRQGPSPLLPSERLHRISLICASLWFESQKEEGGEKKKHNGFCHLSKTERKGDRGSQTCRRCLLGLMGHRPAGGSSALLEPSLALGALLLREETQTGFAVEFSWSRPRDGGPPYWSRLLVMSCPFFSPDTRCMGEFGGHHRENSKFLTYSISKVEKDQSY